MPTGNGTVAEYITALKESDRFGAQVIDHKVYASLEGRSKAVDQLLPAELIA